jgi:thiol-disulfide isomerase/thioredoxin
MIRFHSLIVPLLSSSFLAVFVFSSCLFAVDGLPDQWLQDFEKADEVAAKEKKPIFAVFSTSWCGPCQEMIKSVYPHKDVIAELNNWVPVYVDGDEYRDLAKSHNIIGFPTHILFNTNGVEAARFVGGAADATEFLKRIANAKNFSLKFPPLKAKVAAAPTNTFLLKEMGDLLAKSERMADDRAPLVWPGHLRRRQIRKRDFVVQDMSRIIVKRQPQSTNQPDLRDPCVRRSALC